MMQDLIFSEAYHNNITTSKQYHHFLIPFFLYGSLINKRIKSLDKSRNSITRVTSSAIIFKLMIFSDHRIGSASCAFYPYVGCLYRCRWCCWLVHVLKKRNHSSRSLKIHAFHYHLFSFGGSLHLFLLAEIYTTRTQHPVHTEPECVSLCVRLFHLQVFVASL